MTKRFVDTEIWNKDWFLDLSIKQKLLLKYIYDNCDCAGVYEISYRNLQNCFNEPVSKKDFEGLRQVKFISENKVFVEDFIKFQYGWSMNSLSGKNSGEKLWQMPMAPEYEEKIKSDIADVCHIGNGGAGGSTAAAFLKRFIKGKAAWAHLDIAGCEVIKKPKPMYPKGASGFGVKLLYEYLKSLK